MCCPCRLRYAPTLTKAIAIHMVRPMAIDKDGNPVRTDLCGACGSRRGVHANMTMTNHTSVVRANTRHGRNLANRGRGSQPRRVHCMGSGNPPKGVVTRASRKDQ